MHQCECLTQVQPLGSILFEDHGFPKKCFIQNDIAQLATRLKFQELLPKNIELMNDYNLVAMIKYFYGINEILEHMGEGEARQLVLKCFYDMLGSYLKHIVLPITKYSFYAGNVTYSVAQNVFDLFDRCKELLDTNGNSWSEAITDFSQFNVKIIPLMIPKTSDDEAMKACSNLVTNQNDDDNEEDMLVPLPKIETEDNDDLSTIRLPLKRKHTFNINSKKSAFILLRYFVSVTQCFKYQGINQSLFNKKLNLWITDNVLPYLDDDQLYPAFGAILRILETIKSSDETIYQGTSQKNSKRHKQQLVESKNFFDYTKNINSDEFSFDDRNRDFNWWQNAVLASIGIVILALLLIYMIIRICCNRKKIREVEYKKNSNKKTLKDKIRNVLKNSTHMPEHDEFYEYKKVRNKKGIKFENEKKSSPLRKFRKDKEKVNLPLLNMAESEDEIVLLESKKSTPHSSLSSLSKKTAFKLSEESDNNSKQDMKNSHRFLQKIRPKSPARKNHYG
ncbi:unnamed protein product [Chironomus riparius]|uniref:Uncharacterized protein n=1 Tax=Chironomus riparius TaxID=315576 RepID=A0A9N9S214_9DIPT|nr:unnamed protein product [Chironomus riparius]